MNDHTKFFFHKYKKFIIAASIAVIAIAAYAFYYHEYTALEPRDRDSSTGSSSESITTTNSSVVSSSENGDPHLTDYNMIRIADGEKIENDAIGVSYNTHKFWTKVDQKQITNKRIPGLDFTNTTFSSATFLDFDIGMYVGVVVFYEKTQYTDPMAYLSEYKKRLENHQNVNYQFGNNPIESKKQENYTLGSLLSHYNRGKVVYYQQYMSVIHQGYATTFACYFTNDRYDRQLPLFSILRSISLF